jgi:hypothetical protein
MFSESQYLKAMSMRVAAMRVCINRPESGIPFIPDDIYYLIMGVFVKEYKVAAAIPPETMWTGDLYWPQDRGYDLPKYIKKASIVWINREYGLPNIVYNTGVLTWENGDTIKSYYPKNDIIVTMSRTGKFDIDSVFLDAPLKLEIKF